MPLFELFGRSMSSKGASSQPPARRQSALPVRAPSFHLEPLEDRTLMSFNPIVVLNDPGVAGFAIHGFADAAATGRSVSGAGDVNGDGFGDLVIGSPYAGVGGAQRGQVHVVFGSEHGLGSAIDLDNLGNAGFAIHGFADGALAGWSVSGAGDVNGDGLDDVIVGAPNASGGGVERGESYVIFGNANGLAGSAIDLANLGSAGFALRSSTDNGRVGSSVRGAGDINGDGLDDVIIGAPRAGAGGVERGQSYVVFGKSTGLAGSVVDLDNLGDAGFTLSGFDDRGRAGVSVSGAGDVNGDGLDDLVIGAPYVAIPGVLDGDVDAPDDPSPDGEPVRIQRGQSYVIFGQATGLGGSAIDLGNLQGAGFTINGFERDGEAGASVSGAGDLDGDGYDDILVGAPRSDAGGESSGQSFVVFGKSSGLAGAVVELSALGNAGLTIKGPVGSAAGFSVSGAGDLTGDGRDDLVIGAPHSAVAGASSGQGFVVFGRASGLRGAVVDLNTLGDAGVTINGFEAGASVGFSVSGAGDVNGDGIDDVVLGAPLATTSDTSSGAGYVLFGEDDERPAATPSQAADVNDASTANRYEFTVTLTDNGEVDVDSLGVGDIRVTGPSGYSQLATLVSVSPAGDGGSRTATYFITPPGGTWGAADNGDYSIWVEPGQILDGQGNAAHSGLLGIFEADLTADEPLPDVDGEPIEEPDDDGDLVEDPDNDGEPVEDPDADGEPVDDPNTNGDDTDDVTDQDGDDATVEDVRHFVRRLYRDLLFRDPEPEALAGWSEMLDEGSSREEVALAILESPERRGREVDLLYQSILGRTPDSTERDEWVDAFQDGITTEEAIGGFLSSEEFLAIHPAPTAFLNQLYTGLLLRAPDQAGLDGWTQLLDDDGVELVASSFVASPEFHLAIVDRFYAQYLGRSPDSASRSAWAAQLDSGELDFDGLVVALLGSDEYFARS